MSDFVIMTDSTSDLTKEFQEKYNIDVVMSHYTGPDGVDKFSFLEWTDEYPKAKFFAELKANPAGFTTAPINAAELEIVFKKYLEAGKDVIMICISTGLSGSVDFAKAGAKEALKAYPDGKVTIIDSLRFGPAIGLMCVHASILRSEGKSYDEVVSYLEDNKNRFHQCGWLDDLKYVAKKGRLTNAKAFFGTLAGVKPIGEFDYNGMTTVLAKGKGAKKTYPILLDYMEKTGENLEDQIIFIAESDRHEQAVEYKKLIEEKFHPKAVYINEVFPSCGINIGPGLMAAYYMGKPISSDLSVERKIIEDFMSK